MIGGLIRHGNAWPLVQIDNEVERDSLHFLNADNCSEPGSPTMSLTVGWTRLFLATIAALSGSSST